MKFDTPAGTNPIDQLKVIGHAADRIDDPLKTTGKATYAFEKHDVVALLKDRFWPRVRILQRA